MKLNLLIFLFGFFTACGQVSDTDKQELITDYKRYRSNFESDFISQFPKEIKSEYIRVGYSADTGNNNIGLLLFEVELGPDEINSLYAEVEKMQYKRKYKSSDPGLLTVLLSNNSGLHADSILGHRNNDFGNYLPVPELSNYIDKTSLFYKYLNNEFDIYVLEAKQGNFVHSENLLPNMNMPKNWKNGMSRGISLSKEGRAVIYWSIMW